MRALDLFSGIGGFSLALRPWATTVAYCEIDPDARAVLAANMVRGALARAPVYEDVTKLRASDVAHLRPNIITAGFPCQDVSCASRNPKGVMGSRSRLFLEVARLARTSPSVSHVFLENSACIRTRGMDKVLAALRDAGMSHIAYGVYSAAEVGAQHDRRRWFCLASRAPSSLPTQASQRYEFHARRRREPSERLRPRSRVERARCAMLGNAIVPDCARMAFFDLAIMLHERPAPAPLVRHPMRIVHANRPITMRHDDGTVVDKLCWATPVSSVWAQYRNLTDRSTRMLSNQVFYEEGTRADPKIPPSERSLHYTINPAWVEWLMGYPSGWTRVPRPRG